jgi:hypothetical protein
MTKTTTQKTEWEGCIGHHEHDIANLVISHAEGQNETTVEITVHDRSETFSTSNSRITLTRTEIDYICRQMLKFDEARKVLGE